MEGHNKRDCKKYEVWKQKQENKGNKVLQKANKANEAYGDNDDACFQAKFSNNINNDKGNWFIDSGASSHMAGERDFFTKLEEIPKREIYLADGEVIFATGIGEGILLCDIGAETPKKVLVKEVLFVPALKGNLLSVSKLVQRGMKVEFQDNLCEIVHKGRVVAMAELCSSLYKVRQRLKLLKVSEVNSESKCSPDCIHEWHKRLGHRDPVTIKEVANKQLAQGIQINNCGVITKCEACIIGKMTRLPFPNKSKSQSRSVLDLIHTDVCGPMQTVTPGGKKYMLTVIDDFSRYTEIYLLEYKSQVQQKIEDYVKMVVNKFGRAPKKIRSDRGGEYTGKAFTNFLTQHGIQQELTAPYTPQQNGVAERKNRSLVEMTRCMLVESGLETKYWGEAVRTANHLQNRLPTKGSEDIPYRRWHGKDPDYTYLQTFGTIAYVHQPKEHRQKLDEKAKQLIFVGYQAGSKAYRLLNPDNSKITISRDVKFIIKQQHTSYQEPKNLSDQTSDESVENDKEQKLYLPEEMADQGGARADEDLPVLRRSNRLNKSKPPERLIETINLTKHEEIKEPKTRDEALSGPHAAQWQKAMNEELQSLKDNGTWKLSKLPPEKNLVGSKWVFKLKQDENGVVTRHRARLVAQGYSQKYGHDYNEVFAPVVTQTTLKCLLTVAGKRKMHVKHYDVETAFLHGDIEHEVYMRQPEGEEEKGNEDLVCKLMKNLYGLKQGAMEWYKKLNEILTEKGFLRSKSDPCLYSKCTNDIWMYIVIHVDDIVGASVNEDCLTEFEAQLGETFKIKNLGNLKHYLGMRFERDGDGIFTVDQETYIKSKLNEYGLAESKPSALPIDVNYRSGNGDEGEELLESNTTYRSAIGSLMYLAVNSRPDIAVATSILARKVSTPSKRDWIELKRVYRYLKGTAGYKMHLGEKNSENEANLIGYADADWGGDPVNRRSNSGYFFQIFGGTVCWTSKQQKLVALSSTEAELISLTDACQEALWIERVMTDFNETPPQATTIFEDNQSCIKLLSNRRLSQLTKHIDTKYNFICDLLKEKRLNICYCPTSDMVADMLTKPLNSVKVEKFSKCMGLY